MTPSELQLEAILEPLTERKAELESEEQKLMDEVNMVKDERRKIDRVLRAGGLLESPQPGKTNGNRPSNSRQAKFASPPSAEKVEQVHGAVKKQPVGMPFTRTQIHESLDGISPEKVEQCLQILRDQQVIRLLPNKIKGGGRAYTRVG